MFGHKRHLELKLLDVVISNNTSKAERILSTHPELLFQNVTSIKGPITFKNITAFTYAVWALDTSFCELAFSCLPKNKLGEKMRARLYFDFLRVKKEGISVNINGVDYIQSYFDIKPLTDEIKCFAANYELWLRFPKHCTYDDKERSKALLEAKRFIPDVHVKLKKSRTSSSHYIAYDICNNLENYFSIQVGLLNRFGEKLNPLSSNEHSNPECLIQ